MPRHSGIDLYLHHSFTDRGGRGVYEIFNANDNKTRKVMLGTLRLPPADNTNAKTQLNWFTLEEESDEET